MTKDTKGTGGLFAELVAFAPEEFLNAPVFSPNGQDGLHHERAPLVGVTWDYGRLG